MPELPWEKRIRYKTAYELTDKEVAVFIENEQLSTYFEEILTALGSGKNESDKKKIRLTVNYLLTDYAGLLKKEFGEGDFISHIVAITPQQFAKLIELIASGKVNSRGGKDTLALMYAEAKIGQVTDPEVIAEKNGFIQKNDEGEIRKIAESIVAANPQVVADYKAGKAVALQFFVGQGMKATKGSANPELLKVIFVSLLG
jgi:aspartyl-tRNA(Asn)/glutamyl-tRNA(Gln) amidotransferase subunit B